MNFFVYTYPLISMRIGRVYRDGSHRSDEESSYECQGTNQDTIIRGPWLHPYWKKVPNTGVSGISASNHGNILGGLRLV
jgi:hypothetical protein